MRTPTFIAGLALLLGVACSPDAKAPQPDAKRDVNATAPSDPPAGSAEQPGSGAVVATASTATDPSWRMGDSVVALMGDLHGRTVADLFAGDGYYTWKLLAAGARVLAMDDDTVHVAALLAAKKAKGIGDDRLLIRLSPRGKPVLLPHEADVALITRELTTIPDRQAWFKQVQDGLLGNKPTYVVNFLAQATPVGPPAEQRMSYNSASDEMTTVGYTDISILYRKVPYRYIIFASIPRDQPDDPSAP